MAKQESYSFITMNIIELQKVINNVLSMGNSINQVIQTGPFYSNEQHHSVADYIVIVNINEIGVING